MIARTIVSFFNSLRIAHLTGLKQIYHTITIVQDCIQIKYCEHVITSRKKKSSVCTNTVTLHFRFDLVTW